MSRLRTNLACLERQLRDSAASMLRVEGGWYAIVRMPALMEDEDWALTLLNEDELQVQPGYYYELSGVHLVLSLITPEVDFAKGAQRLAARVHALCA